MSNYVFNENEIEILRLLKATAVSDDTAIKCEITKEEIAESLGLSVETVTDILNILEENFIIMSRDDGYFNISHSAYESIDKDFSVLPDETEPEIVHSEEPDEVADDSFDNVYEEQHKDFSELRVDEMPNGTNENIKPADVNADIKMLMKKGIISAKPGNIQKITDDNVISVSSVLADNIGSVKTAVGKEVVIEGGTVIPPDSDSYSFNSYTDKTVKNVPFNEEKNGSNTPNIPLNTPEAVKAIYSSGSSTNMAAGKVNTAEKLINKALDEAKSEENKSKYEYEYDPIQLINDTDITISSSVDQSLTERLKIANFSDIAKRTAENRISLSYDTVFKHQGYLDSNTMGLSGLAMLSVAVSSANAISKVLDNMQDTAVKTYEKVISNKNLSDFDIALYSENTRKSMTNRLLDEGFSKKEVGNLFKHKDHVINEFEFRDAVIDKLKTDKKFLSSNTELREYIEKKGFKKLSGMSQLKLIDELNKYNGNASIRNVVFSELKTSQFKKTESLFKSINPKDKFTSMLLKKAVRSGKKRDIEMFTGKHGMKAAARLFLLRADFGRQDLLFSTVRNTASSAIDSKNRVKFTIVAGKVAIQFAKKTEKFTVKALGYAYEKINRGKSLKRVENSIKEKRIKKTGLKKVSSKEFVRAYASLKSTSSEDKDANSTIKSDPEKQESAEKRAMAVHRVTAAKDTFKKTKKTVNNISTAMKNARESKFKKAGAKEAIKDAKKAAKAAKNAKNTAEAVKEGTKITRFIQGISKLLASIPAPVWIVIAIVAAIFLILHLLLDINSSIVGFYDSVLSEGQEMSKDFANGIGKALIEPIKEMHESVILVNDKLDSYSDRYMDITEYLEKVQELDERREENAIKFAKARLFTYTPEQMGLSNSQINGRNGQNADILAGKKTEYYGSLDKKNPYTLHYMDAYGNEIANHSTNAKDILSLCAVMYGNAYDRSHAFKILVEDEWYLMNPEIKWQESDVYCCERNNCEMVGDTTYYLLCGDKYGANGSLEYYYCNKFEDVSKIKQYINSGVKVTGDIVNYSSNGCKVRILDKYMRIPVDKRYFKGTGVTFTEDDYDLYDAYRDGWISYDDYLDIWHDCDNDGSLDVSYMDGTFYKEEHYCPGHYTACCFGHKDIDLYITLYDKEYAYSNNIYPDETTSHTGQYRRYSKYFEDFLLDNGFNNDGNCRWADKLYDNDWYDLYGVDILGGVGFQIGGVLSNADIDRILSGLSDQDVTIKQQAIIEFALQYVGRIPYYWGGKAESLDYEGNHFYSIVEADYKGRTRKGLDCSGFVQWVMANNGIRVPGSTAGYSSYQTTRDHSTLKIGDLGFANPPGSKSNHIGIYAGTDENGNDIWIHCNSSAGNVSVNNYNGFKYYISL